MGRGSLVCEYHVKVNENHPNQNMQWLFIPNLLDSKGVSHHHLYLADSKGRQMNEKSLQLKNRMASGISWEAVGIEELYVEGQTRSRAFYVVDKEYIVGFLHFLNFLNYKWEQNLENLSIINQTLAI